MLRSGSNISKEIHLHFFKRRIISVLEVFESLPKPERMMEPKRTKMYR
jgi:hypothetical protein